VSRALFIDNVQHSAHNTSGTELHQLLMILSDGRGVFAEGTLVRQLWVNLLALRCAITVHPACSKKVTRTRSVCGVCNSRSTTQGSHNFIVHTSFP